MKTFSIESKIKMINRVSTVLWIGALLMGMWFIGSMVHLFWG